MLCGLKSDSAVTAARKCPKCNGRKWDVREYKKCAECGSRDLVYKNCATCPLNKLAEQRANTANGALIHTTVAFEHALQHFKFDPNDVTQEQMICLRILEEERAKYREEELKRR
jgi:hypothetical protein